MISELRNRKSLTFYQSTVQATTPNTLSTYTGGLGAIAISTGVYATATTTTQFNNQLNGFLNSLHAQRDKINQKVAANLAKDPNYTSARNDGVQLAWDYERDDIAMGGKGSASWNKEQQQEILKNKKVRGAEGHHQKNVADHPDDQGNPDNIKFYKSKKEHLEKGHNGDFRNGSDGPLIDKDKMLKKTNGKRVFKNELRGIGIATAIGAGIGFTIGFAASLAQSGVTPETMKYAMTEGGKAGLSSGMQSVASYGTGRTLGQLATHALEGMFSNMGMTITENVSKMCNMGAVGAITITVFSVYQLLKLVHNGMATKEAALQIGKQTLFSLSLLAVSIAAQGIWGGPAGLVVSISTGIVFITYALTDTVHQRLYSDKIRVYMINECKPSFS